MAPRPVLARRRLPRFFRLGAQLVGDRLFRGRPVAVQGVDQVALGGRGPVGLAPGCAARGLDHTRRVVAESGEEFAPAWFDGVRIFLVLRLQGLDVEFGAHTETKSAAKPG